MEARMPILELTKVSATPGVDSTEYRIDTEQAVLSTPLVSKLGKDTGYEEQQELRRFGEVTHLTDLGLTRMLAKIPSTYAAL